MPGYNAGQTVKLTDNRIAVIIHVIVADDYPFLAQYQVMIIAEENITNVAGTDIAEEITSHKKKVAASLIKKHRALLTQIGSAPSAFLWEVLTEVEKDNPVVGYHNPYGHKNALDHVSTGSVSNTARSMFLDRFARMPGKKGSQRIRYGFLEGADNYLWCLGLDIAALHEWQGQTVLDIGCGYSIFYAEVAVIFGINVIPIDMIARDPLVVDSVIERYVRNMCFLKVLLEFSNPEACGMEEIEIELFDLAFGRLLEIVNFYRNNQPRQLNIITADLSTLQYSGVISCYLFCYFNAQGKQDALVNICRHMTKPGWIRICTGMQGIDPHSLGFADEVLLSTTEELAKNSIAITSEKSAEMTKFTVKSMSFWSSWF